MQIVGIELRNCPIDNVSDEEYGYSFFALNANAIILWGVKTTRVCKVVNWIYIPQFDAKGMPI